MKAPFSSEYLRRVASAWESEFEATNFGELLTAEDRELLAAMLIDWKREQ